MAFAFNQIFKVSSCQSTSPGFNMVVFIVMWMAAAQSWSSRHSEGPPWNTPHIKYSDPRPHHKVKSQSTSPSYSSINSFVSYVSNICHVMVLDPKVHQQWRQFQVYPLESKSEGVRGHKTYTARGNHVRPNRGWWRLKYEIMRIQGIKKSPLVWGNQKGFMKDHSARWDREGFAYGKTLVCVESGPTQRSMSKQPWWQNIHEYKWVTLQAKALNVKLSLCLTELAKMPSRRHNLITQLLSLQLTCWLMFPNPVCTVLCMPFM